MPSSTMCGSILASVRGTPRRVPSIRWPRLPTPVTHRSCPRIPTDPVSPSNPDMAAGPGRITVIGLGPGDPGLVSAAALDAIDRIPIRRLRTSRHPTANLVPDAETFDHHYEHAERFEDVYEAIAKDLIALAGVEADVLYAVPGSPDVLERSVELLRLAAQAGDVDLDIQPAVSFLELAWSRLGVDPFETGVTLIDGHRFEEMAHGRRGPMLIAHCHNRRVLSDIKLSVDQPPQAPVTILQRLGLPRD